MIKMTLTAKQIEQRKNKKKIKNCPKLGKRLETDKTVLFGGPNGKLEDGEFFHYTSIGVHNPGKDAIVTAVYQYCVCKKLKNHYALFVNLRDPFFETKGSTSKPPEFLYSKDLSITDQFIDLVDSFEEADKKLYDLARQPAEKYANSVGIPFEDNTVRGKSSDK